MKMEKYYITTPIYYANGSPHIGHFLTTTIADSLARYHRNTLGAENVYFTTGLDEHGTTVEQSATKAGYDIENIQEYVDKRAVEWKKAFDDTNISYDYFVRTTNTEHKSYAQEFIGRMIDNGDVYQGTYEGKYCNGCEKFLTLSDLDERGLCPLHREDQVIEVVEKNYFFKLSKYANKIKQLIHDGTIDIQPENKKNEMLARLEQGIEDVSISRPKEKVAWGVKFPGDENQTVYVWVEALINYKSSLEINNKQELWSGVRHLVGKDINWFHNVIWPAMLLSANYELYKGSFVHGFLKVGGQKISKSLGNIITPKDLLDKFGADGARYLILANLPYKNDSDVTIEALEEKYNADLANGLGNTVARITKLIERSGIEFERFEAPKDIWQQEWAKHFETYEINKVLESIWRKLSSLDKHINEHEPWAIKDSGKLEEVLKTELKELREIALMIEPLLPETSLKLQVILNERSIKGGIVLFPRLD